MAQPDNAEFQINGTPESCLAVLNNVYNDGVNWHDVACYHPKVMIAGLGFVLTVLNFQ